MYPLRRLLLPVLMLIIALQVVRAQISTPSFDWDQRWHNYLYRTYSFERITLLALDTGFEHLVTPEHSRDIRQYPEQYGTALARRISRTTVEFGLGGLLGEDIRRRPSNKSGVMNRTLWAITHSYMGTDREGKWRPAYSRLAGTGAAFAVGSRIRERPITTGRIGEAYLGSFLFNMQDSVLNEFQPDFQRIGYGMARKWLRALGLRR